MSDTFTEKWRNRPHIRFGDPCFRCGIGMAPGTPMYLRKNGIIPDDMRQHGGHGLCTSCAKQYRIGRYDPDNPSETNTRSCG